MSNIRRSRFSILGFRSADRRTSSAFTLVELMVVTVVIAILATLITVAMAGAMDMARASRTRTQIAKLNSIITELWQEYETRRVPILIPAGTSPRDVAQLRLDALRELMRLELPDRYSDIEDPPVSGVVRPSLSRAYRRVVDDAKSANSGPLLEYQGAECLYLIVSMASDRSRKAIEFFQESEIGDVDNDGMPEILDAWGEPIRFLRWAPGFSRPLAAPSSAPIQHFSPIQVADPSSAPDPFDPRGIYAKYALYPLIISAGPDKKWDMAFTFGTDQLHYSDNTNPPANDPFRDWSGTASGSLLGLVGDDDTDVGTDNFVDNLHNHLMETSTN